MGGAHGEEVDMRSLSKTIVGGLALVGLARAYESAVIRGAGRRIAKLEHDVEYDEDLHFCRDGEPLMLVDPSYATTVFFFDGFRIRPAVGMNRDWLTALHREHKVNIVAPVIGLQSMPYWLRSKEWSYVEELRQAIQVYDSYASKLAPGHRMVPVSFSFGSVAALTIAAKRNPDEVLLLSPIPAQLALPEQQINRLPNWIRELARKVLRTALEPDGLLRGRRMGWFQYVLPIYMRPGEASGGWDVADRECRERVNASILNGQELRLRDLLEIYDAMKFIRTRLLPQLAGRRITVFSGRKDSIMTSETADLFVEQLRAAGGEVEHLAYSHSAHNLLLDCEAEHVLAALTERICRVDEARGETVVDLTEPRSSAVASSAADDRSPDAPALF